LRLRCGTASQPSEDSSTAESNVGSYAIGLNAGKALKAANTKLFPNRTQLCGEAFPKYSSQTTDFGGFMAGCQAGFPASKPEDSGNSDSQDDVETIYVVPTDLIGLSTSEAMAKLEALGLRGELVAGEALEAGEPRINFVYDAAPLGSVPVDKVVKLLYYTEAN
jgi:hypothetical protein